MSAYPGFRLYKFELLNWGTFHDRIWTIPLGGENCLVTGDIGSGKSTLVDAITTLLVPPGKAAYNRAAGAESKERTLRSYVEGHYKSERYEHASARPVSLRGPKHYSVILGCFRNDETDSTVTLAQVFWMKPGEAQPDRFFVVSERELSIAADFTDFGGDMANLRRALKNSGEAIPSDFKRYRAQFIRLLGIRNEQALNLFHQTVSMKSVGKLTDFVRDHMLEPFDAGERISNLIAHFDDLTRAHESIVTARDQISQLSPIVSNCADYALLASKEAEISACIDAAYTYFALQRAGLLEREEARLFQERLDLKTRLKSLDDARDDAARRVRELDRDIQDNGGGRIEALREAISKKEHQVDSLKKTYADYTKKADSLGFPRIDDAEGLVANMNRLVHLKMSCDAERTRNTQEAESARIELHACETKLSELRDEIKSIKASRSNIPRGQIALRSALASELGVREDAIPFVGELLQVKPDERDWEGAAERILHNFGASLIVPDEWYKEVSEWVEDRHLGVRLVYYRVKNTGVRRRLPEKIHPDSLVNKIDIKPDSPFYDWLEDNLAARFNYVCCDDMASFRRESRAVTKAGQIKANEERHEKDDRTRIDDRSRYVLGWDNRQKLQLLEGHEKILAAELDKLSTKLRELAKKQTALDDTLDSIGALKMFTDYANMDWQGAVRELEALRTELDVFVAASHKLALLTERRDATKKELDAIELERDGTLGRLGTAETRHENTKAEMAKIGALLTDSDLRLHEPSFDALDVFCRELFGESEATLKNLDGRERETLRLMSKRKDEVALSSRKVNDKTVKLMVSFRAEYPLETTDFDATMDAAGEFGELLSRLERDDLPRHEARFKEFLNENTIREIAAFEAALWREKDEIEDRIATINRSLAAIDYNPGRYIQLEAHASPSGQIALFKEQIRACTDNTITGPGDDAYSEKKFLKVCELIQRFKGRPDHSDSDRRWTAFVTDVRNWFDFSASEKWHETGEEHEHYTDSGGKSGGQKEKLAYTVLAAGLAYQFGLDSAHSRAKTFRFVMIDEAFGRGSNESAHFALTLFQTLGLQLLVCTPMQKHRVIEPFVPNVAFIHIRDDKYSSVKTMSIEEYVALGRRAADVDDAG